MRVRRPLLPLNDMEVEMSKWVAHYFCRSCKERLVGDTICYANVCPHCGVHPLNFDTRAARWIVEYQPTWFGLLFGKEETGHWEYKG